jgi:tRNA pseudouridine38-40 synthase
MRNILLNLEYDGTAFHGWQRQPGERTVQGTLEDAVYGVFGQRTDVVGAGRTDTGVHAVDYPCNFHVETGLSTERIAAALGAHLPDDVVVKDAEDVHEQFHARFDALSRRYAYRISTRPTALWRHVYHTPRFAIDPALMGAAAEHLVGEHDFTSFTPTANEADPICRVIDVAVTEESPLVTFAIEADRFLHHMVRVMVGTLIEVGSGADRPPARTGPRGSSLPPGPARRVVLGTVAVAREVVLLAQPISKTGHVPIGERQR